MTEYRIDDLARTVGTTVRNVRVYQDRGLLPAPVRRGRVAVYTEEHLARLRTVVQLLARGYGFAQIREMLDVWERGHDLGDLLGLEKLLVAPWSDEEPVTVSLADLRREFGRRAGVKDLKRAIAIGLVERRGAHLVIRSPRLWHAGRELLAAGIAPTRILDLAEQLRRRTDDLAGLFLDTVRRDLLDTHPADWVPDTAEVKELTELVVRLRPLAATATVASLAMSMEIALNDLLDERIRGLLRATGKDHP